MGPRSDPSQLDGVVLQYELSALEFEVCWELAHVGEPPAILNVPFTGRTDTERRQVVASVIERLRPRGLADRRGLDRDLADLLAVFTHYTWAAEAWLALDRPVRAMAAQAGLGGAVALIDGDRVELRECSEQGLLEALVGVPGIVAGPGTPVQLCADNLDVAVRAAGRDMQRLARELASLGVHTDDANCLVRMCEGHEKLAQFGVLVRGRTGRRTPGERVIGLHATQVGWYLQLRRHRAGRETVTVGPAQPADVVAQLRSLLAETREVVSS